MSAWSRRDLLRAALAGGLLAGRRGWALGDASRVDVCELVLPEGSLQRPSAWRHLLYQLQMTTSVEVADRVVALPPEDPALFDHPFAVLVGREGFPPLSERQVEQLRRYVSYGGFLLVDDASGLEHSDFDRSVRRLCARMFPTRPLAPLPREHSVYRSFFLVERPLGRLDLVPWLEGIELGAITPVILSRNDLSGALERTASGQGRLPVVPGGEAQRREAVKLAINLVLYALTSNYKQDQAHVRRLMEEGRLE